eukprot:Clim_evm1s64 gene=Clim_evmTU1s64
MPSTQEVVALARADNEQQPLSMTVIDQLTESIDQRIKDLSYETEQYLRNKSGDLNVAAKSILEMLKAFEKTQAVRQRIEDRIDQEIGPEEPATTIKNRASTRAKGLKPKINENDKEWRKARRALRTKDLEIEALERLVKAAEALEEVQTSINDNDFRSACQQCRRLQDTIDELVSDSEKPDEQFKEDMRGVHLSSETADNDEDKENDPINPWSTLTVEVQEAVKELEIAQARNTAQLTSKLGNPWRRSFEGTAVVQHATHGQAFLLRKTLELGSSNRAAASAAQTSMGKDETTTSGAGAVRSAGGTIRLSDLVLCFHELGMFSAKVVLCVNQFVERVLKPITVHRSSVEYLDGSGTAKADGAKLVIMDPVVAQMVDDKESVVFVTTWAVEPETDDDGSTTGTPRSKETQRERLQSFQLRLGNALRMIGHFLDCLGGPITHDFADNDYSRDLQESREAVRAAIGYVLLKPYAALLTGDVDMQLEAQSPEDSGNGSMTHEEVLSSLLETLTTHRDELVAMGLISADASDHIDEIQAIIDGMGSRATRHRRDVALGQAREIILSKGTDLVEVSALTIGAEGSAAANPLPELEAAVRRISESMKKHGLSMSASPFHFEACKITGRCQRLLGLISELIAEAASTQHQEDRVVALFQAVRDALLMYHALIPVLEAKELEELPQSSMLFYNDCRWIAQCCLTMGLKYHKQFPENMRDWLFTVDLVPYFMEAGHRCLDDQVKRQREVLGQLVAEIPLSDVHGSKEATRALEKAISRSLLEYKRLSRVWAEVADARSNQTQLATLAGFMLESLTDRLFAMDAIDAEDCGPLSKQFERLSTEVEKVLGKLSQPTTDVATGVDHLLLSDETKDTQHLTAFSVMATRCRTVSMVLQSSLVEIQATVTASGGANADTVAVFGVTRLQFRRLVRALFTDSDAREQVLSLIG